MKVDWLKEEVEPSPSQGLSRDTVLPWLPLYPYSGSVASDLRERTSLTSSSVRANGLYSMISGTRDWKGCNRTHAIMMIPK
jgi:hypothetical protein